MERYQRNLEEAEARGEVRAGQQGTRAWALIGMSVFMGLRFGIWERDRDPEEVGRIVSDLIANGLKP